jgi:hypothetical protein
MTYDGSMKRKNRWILGAVLALVALGGGGVALPSLLFGDHVDYSHVQSIEREPTYQDPALLQEAFTLPVAAAYQRAGLDYQHNLSFCGPTTAVDVDRSLGTAIDQAHILDGTDVHATLGMVWGGLTLDQEAELLRRKTGCPVTVLRDLDLAQFRAELAHANDPGRRYTVNFSRGPLFGRGGGHHSPIGAYLPDRDLVLVLDVNEKYKPWLVSTARLFAAVDTVDRQTGKKRGLLRIE